MFRSSDAEIDFKLEKRRLGADVMKKLFVSLATSLI